MRISDWSSDVCSSDLTVIIARRVPVSVIRVVSYNIHKGRSATGGRESLSDLRLGLYGLHPDLLFLQEVQGRNDQRLSLDTQHEFLAAALTMHAAYGCNAIRPHTYQGHALLSRYPILEPENPEDRKNVGEGTR